MSNISLRPLAITPEVRDRAKAVQDYAFEHRENLVQLRNRMSTGALPPGDFDNFVLNIERGYKVVYSINQQPAPHNWCHQISISVDTPKMMPNPQAVVEILKLFGIEPKLNMPHGVLAEAVTIWEERVSAATTAVNLLFSFNIATWLQARTTAADASSQG